MSEELKPVKCGCGGEAKVCKSPLEDGYCYFVKCERCETATNIFVKVEEAIMAWNKAMGADRGLDEWCTDCKEYDQEKHCCHRWNRVIKYVVDEVREKYDERTAKVKHLERRSETSMSWEGICTNCGSYTMHEMNYCFHCGARLEWE